MPRGVEIEGQMKHPAVAAILGAFLLGAWIASALIQKWGSDLTWLVRDAAGSTLVAGAGGAVVGAAVGGLITYVLAHMAAAEARIDRLTTNGRRLMIKASLILS